MSSLNPSASGSSVTADRSVNPSTATATVTFKEAEATLGNRLPHYRHSSFTTIMFSVGSHSLTAFLWRSTRAMQRASATLTQTVMALPVITQLQTAPILPRPGCPGSITSILGTSLANAAVSASALPLGTSLGGRQRPVTGRLRRSSS